MELAPPIFKELAIDGAIVDQVIAGGGTAAERAGVPFVTVCTAPPWNVDVAQPPPFTSWPYKTGLMARLRNRYGYAGWSWFIAPTLRMINRYRKRWGLRRYARMDDSYSSLAQISQLFPEFDFPRSSAPKCFHYVGALAADREYSADGFPWDRLDGRPIIYASLGTIADPMNRQVYPKIAAACQGLPTQLVLARGKWDEDEGGREATYNLPGDPLVVDYAPQLALLDRAAVLVTHAGLNTTLESISRGVPMVALPRSADQPGNAARIAYSGAGLCSSFHHGTPEELRGVIERVLAESRFREQVALLRQAMIAAGGPRRAADIVELAMTARRPVLKNDALEAAASTSTRRDAGESAQIPEVLKKSNGPFCPDLSGRRRSHPADGSYWLRIAAARAPRYVHRPRQGGAAGCRNGSQLPRTENGGRPSCNVRRAVDDFWLLQGELDYQRPLCGRIGCAGDALQVAAIGARIGD